MSKNIKILYVDDEPINLRLFVAIFGKKYTIITSDNGINALKILEENTDINIIFTDMKMPIMNGLEFIKKAKNTFPKKHYYILTGFELTPEIKLAIDSGLILKCISKPLNNLEIESIIESSL